MEITVAGAIMIADTLIAKLKEAIQNARRLPGVYG